MFGLLPGKKNELTIGAERKAGRFLTQGKNSTPLTMQDIQAAQQGISNIQGATVKANIRKKEWEEVGKYVDAHYDAEGARLNVANKVVEGETKQLQQTAELQVKVNNYQMTGWETVLKAQDSVRKLL